MAKLGIMILGSVFGLVGSYALCDFAHVAVTRHAAFQEARRLSNGKGIINIGAGPCRG